MRPVAPASYAGENSARRIVILGAYGLLGHKLLQTWQHLLPATTTIVGTVRHGSQARALRALPGLVSTARVRSGVDALQFDTVEALLLEEQPHIVINCVAVLAPPTDDAAQVLFRSASPHSQTIWLSASLGAG
jgi:dTDP-4-dehydrorhamnose reductase